MQHADKKAKTMCVATLEESLAVPQETTLHMWPIFTQMSWKLSTERPAHKWCICSLHTNLNMEAAKMSSNREADKLVINYMVRGFSNKREMNSQVIIGDLGDVHNDK